MNYKDYITKYLQENSKNFLSVLNLKQLLKSNQQTLMLFIFSVLLVIFCIGALSLSVVHATIGNILFGFFFVLLLIVSFLTLYQRFTHVLVAYVKHNKIFWEFITIPREIEKTIPDDYIYQVGKKFIKILVCNHINGIAFIEKYNPYNIDIETPVNPQELAATNEQSSIKRLTVTTEKNLATEILQKGVLLTILGGIGFLIFILTSEILNKV
tara:strand:+ start:1203 stop:1838 length:636 start_codon:yes stop_codon:yes gene_type:complete